MNFINMTIYDQYLGNEVHEKNYVFFFLDTRIFICNLANPQNNPIKIYLEFFSFFRTPPHKHLNKISLVRPSLGPPTVLTYIV